MPQVHFTDDFDFKAKPGVTIAYKAGWTGMVTTPCADQAVASKKAKRVAKKAEAEADDGGQA
ncbi:hypothetical protein [Pelagibacterium lentulum]|uniref:Uncharacterized protein n=1 Tax=Pelagibacterium lentulum TaxID=2029865 RepID=A0A916RPU7_9HYPH|nr:hypothetical protein [Pelagibacterium lentulum]GGA63858.1 hypothetical protein GCM10011499_37810 [Pelagibacterium lentulum]